MTRICRSDMGKWDKYRGLYDPVAALGNAADLLGMELTEHGAGLQGGYYINGDRHAYRRDKLKVFISRGSVWVSEEGGPTLSLPNWLMQYGGAADFRDAIRMINGKPQAIDWNRQVRERKEPQLRYVSGDVLEAARAYDLQRCPLFRWMGTLFPEEAVREVWDAYNVTTDAHGNAVFWYVDQDGHILYDKRISYKEDGHRDRSFFPGRQYRVADGYAGRCYFGAHHKPDGKKAFVMESEKSVLLCALYFGHRRFMACGGKSNLHRVEPDMLLVPDMDARIEWEEKGPIWPWWEKWPGGMESIPEHADIGDMIEFKMIKR